MSGFYEDKIDMIFARAKSPSSIQNVELIFPHKNCRIDSLLSPKAFVHARRYTSDGVEQISHIHQDDNLLIKGDNLFALASLQEKYRNQVRMIYWDVPYNTGSLSFSYNDNLERSSWLLFIKNRVEQALPLLKEEDGVFLIQCSFHQ